MLKKGKVGLKKPTVNIGNARRQYLIDEDEFSCFRMNVYVVLNDFLYLLQVFAVFDFFVLLVIHTG